MPAPDSIPLVPDPAQPPTTRGVVLRRAAFLYDLLTPIMMFGQEQRANRRTLAALPLHPAARVLDMGCATGALTRGVARRLVAARGGLALGIDASPDMVAVARRRSASLPCRFDLVSAEALPYPDAVFDAVVSSFFLHHLDRTDKLRALREAWRVLKPGSPCLITDIDRPYNAFGRLTVATAEHLFHQPQIGENAQGILPELFAAAGFSEVQRAGRVAGYISLFVMKRT
jgi:demethylmenaquinone methyltransferase/2-methoxy-6-polyprenyl-1,4-benzoquinol methylase